jgi:3-oxoacyl-[acyl-carrier protein] reductase
MTDRIEGFINSKAGKKILGAIGVATPVELKRYHSGLSSYLEGDVLLDCGDNAALLKDTLRNIKDSAAVITLGARAQAQSGEPANNGSSSPERYQALVFDASGLSDSLQLIQAYEFFNQNIRKLKSSGRIVILARPHMECGNAAQAACQRALEGLSRSLAKEVGKKGATATLITVANNAEANIDSSLRFALSAKSAYVDAQVIKVSTASNPALPDWHKPLAGRVALVTGASRGIGLAIAQTLARDGATVLGVDVGAMEAELIKAMTAINGAALVADITAEDAPAKIGDSLKELGGVDLIVHNAGVTRDKTIANMSEQQWQLTLNINLAAAQRITEALLSDGVINDGASIVGVSSMNGIAGQRGQTNYAASKAGVIGYVDFMSKDPELLKRGITVNAVAPGFIETAMTAAIPLMTRMFGRRLNSLSQGGLPIDVAETIAFFGNPASRAVNGNVVRVCGQAWFGA